MSKLRISYCNSAPEPVFIPVTILESSNIDNYFVALKIASVARGSKAIEDELQFEYSDQFYEMCQKCKENQYVLLLNKNNRSIYFPGQSNVSIDGQAKFTVTQSK